MEEESDDESYREEIETESEESESSESESEGEIDSEEIHLLLQENDQSLDQNVREQNDRDREQDGRDRDQSDREQTADPVDEVKKQSKSNSNSNEDNIPTFGEIIPKSVKSDCKKVPVEWLDPNKHRNKQEEDLNLARKKMKLE